jgi:RNA polymerase sigma-70 factor (ECF subfamily)
MGTSLSGATDCLRKFQQGDAAAFEELFRLHQGEVFRWIVRIVRSPAAAEDLTVETFWRIFRAHARFDPRHGFAPWARRIATHAAFDWLRLQRPEDELPADVMDESASDPAVSAEIRRATASAFGRLPAKLRIAAVLAVVEERPYREISEAIGISVAAVKLRVFRALRLLRKDLEQQGIRP